MQLFSLVFCWPWHCDNWMPAIIECLPMLVNTKRICLQWTRGWQIQTRVVGLSVQPLIQYWRTHSPRMVQGCRQRGGGFLSAYYNANIWIVCPKSTMYSNIQHPSPTILPTCLQTCGDSEISRKLIDLGTQQHHAPQVDLTCQFTVVYCICFWLAIHKTYIISSHCFTFLDM